MSKFFRDYKARRPLVARGPHPGWVAFEQVRRALATRPSESMPLAPTTPDVLPSATHALAAAAYRGLPLQAALDIFPGSRWKKGISSLLAPDAGEAFARLVQQRTLSSQHPRVVRSFGMSASRVVEHCLAASATRRRRDRALAVIVIVTCWLFLPGTLVWLLAMQAGSAFPRLGRIPIAVVGLLSAWLLWPPPFDGGAGAWYVRLLLAAPYAGWLASRELSVRTAAALRQHADRVYEGHLGTRVPEAAPTGPGDVKAEALREALARLDAEEEGNVVFYDESGAVLGLGARWGSWSLREELHDRDNRAIVPFQVWEVVSGVARRMRDVATGEPLTVGQWAAFPIAGPLHSGPKEPDTRAFTVGPADLQQLLSASTSGKSILMAQCPLQHDQSVVTLLIRVAIEGRTLQVTVDGYALGPVSPYLLSPPSSHWSQGAKAGPFHRTELPVDATEVCRLMGRAPFTLLPAPFLDLLGGRLVPPEPFSLRSSTAHPPWSRHAFTNEALQTAQTVLRHIHTAITAVLAEHNVDLSAPDTCGDTDHYVFVRAHDDT
ncbi:hypothetical protein ACFVU0_14030 [Streptomyces sp. NPDC058122]|uniref:hypothetical protein n=1 Tax=Streptomyces sp. NPDC058122 TaxID=3346349 RepID=UPI0036EA4550